MKYIILILLVIFLSIITALITSNYYIKKFMEVTDKLDKEYVDKMVEETLKIVKEFS